MTLVSWNCRSQIWWQFPQLRCQSSPSTCMSACDPTPYLRMGGSFTLVDPLTLLHTGPPCPSWPVLPSLHSSQCLIYPMLRSCPHHPVPRYDVITIVAGICSTCIPGQVAVLIPVVVDASHFTMYILSVIYLLITRNTSTLTPLYIVTHQFAWNFLIYTINLSTRKFAKTFECQ